MKLCIRKIAGMSLALGLSFLSAGCGMEEVKVVSVTTGMGTVVQETLYVKKEEAGQECMVEIEELLQHYEEEVLSWRVADSEIARINETAGDDAGFSMTEQMQQYLKVIWEVSQKSDGALDVTLGQVTELWNLDKWAMEEEEYISGFIIPQEAEINSLLEYTGYEKITISHEQIFIPQNMKLDLGAVGKGIVCDEIGEYLKGQQEITGGVITVGGSVVTYGSKPDRRPWQIAIVNPREDGAYLGTLALEGEWYVATSGDYERYIEFEGKRYHHIMHPDTGYPVDNEVCGVTIASDSGLLSDALSTACFVLGVEEGMKLAQELGAEALFVTKEEKLFMTEGMKQYFVATGK